MSLNLPNALTVARVVATPVICGLLFAGGQFYSWLALVLFIVACVTDFLDGYFARIWGQSSPFGRMLDPIADKLLVASVLMVLTAIDRLHGLSLIPAAVILWREILVSGLREYLAELRVSVPVTRLAKWKTTLQMVALGFLVVGEAGPSLGVVDAPTVGVVGLWIAAGLTLVTGYDYLRASFHHMTSEEGSAEPGQRQIADRPREAR